jgi:hypothetical protein
MKQSTKTYMGRSHTELVPSIVWAHKDAPQEKWIRDTHTHVAYYWRTEDMEVKA